jgi:hypothetical protein
MESSTKIFQNAIDKAYSSQPNVKINPTTMGDALKYKSNFTEEKGEEISKDNQKDMIDGIIEIVKKVKDINNRKTIAKDMIRKFKRENIKTDYNKFMKDCGLGETMKKETNEVEDDEYEYKTFLEKSRKKETKEATGSGSSGAYSGPVFGGNDEFWERSRSETPKLKESDVEKVEAKEATTSGSVGGYETPAMWAKSTKKKDWGPSRKTQIPGGGFVKVKKKCTKFPYCNQGDINNLKISKNESVKEAIQRVAKKMGISSNVVMTILEHEYEKVNKRTK